MKKILSILVCVCVLLSAMVITASAAETSATISFADTANRTSLSTTQQVWEQNGIKVTGNKSNSTNDVKDYSNPARFYKGSSVTIEYPGMTKLVIDATGAEAKYRAWDSSFTDSNATATVDGSIESPRFTVLSTPPAAVTAPENAPAQRNIRHIVMMFSSPTPFAISAIFWPNFTFLFWQNATHSAIRNATMAGIA